MKDKLYIGIIIPLIIGAIFAGATATVDVAKLKERVVSQKEQINDIHSDVRWMRNNWNKR